MVCLISLIQSRLKEEESRMAKSAMEKKKEEEQVGKMSINSVVKGDIASFLLLFVTGTIPLS
jgi:hypothetical protein